MISYTIQTATVGVVSLRYDVHAQEPTEYHLFVKGRCLVERTWTQATKDLDNAQFKTQL